MKSLKNNNTNPELNIVFYGLLLLFIFFNSNKSVGQSNSWDGNGLSPNTTVRSLNICVNIIYYCNSSLNPAPGGTPWPYNTTEGVQTSSYPSFIWNMIDENLSATGNYTGSLTKKFYESSFGNLTILGDYIFVNILHSKMSATCGGFNDNDIITEAITRINTDGFTSAGGNNSLGDYDFDTDGNLDLVNFFIRNSNPPYGEQGEGQGWSSASTSGGLYPLGLTIAGITSIDAQRVTFQCVGNNDFSNIWQNPAIHEIAHMLFGPNSFHSAGGNHYVTTDITTFMGIQGGYGLMGGSFSNLTSCNGFDRWRMNWVSDENTTATPVAALNSTATALTESTIDNSSGDVTFILRDFVTYGDAVRISFPYKSTTTASNQYLWLENHQVGRNNKIDYNLWSQANSCFPEGTPGIYAYIQVGKDERQGTNVWPSDETDNLKFLSAEGSYDIKFNNETTNDCASWGSRNVGKNNMSNPICGENDFSQYFYETVNNTLVASGNDDYWMMVKKNSDGTYDNKLPVNGGTNDAFIHNSVLDISSNPAPVNAITYYVTQYGGTINAVSTTRNCTSVFLTGLSIKMTEYGADGAMKRFKVEIKWDDYDVKKDVRWTGPIVLNETINLLAGKTISLEQCLTPLQHTRVTATGEFADITSLTCEDGSSMTIQQGAKLHVKEGSNLILRDGSTTTINDGEIIIEDGAEIEIQNGATLNINGSGRLIVKCTGTLTAISGATINLNNTHSFIIINSSAGTITGLTTVVPSGKHSQILDYKTNDGMTSDITIGTKTYTIDSNEKGRGITTTGTISISNNIDVRYISGSEGTYINSPFSTGSGSTFEVMTNAHVCD